MTDVIIICFVWHIEPWGCADVACEVDHILEGDTFFAGLGSHSRSWTIGPMDDVRRVGLSPAQKANDAEAFEIADVGRVNNRRAWAIVVSREVHSDISDGVVSISLVKPQ